MPLLIARPGELTRRYIDGERVHFVSPLALFLFVISVIFAMLSVIGAQLELPVMAGARPADLAHALAANEDRGAVLSEQLRRASTPSDVARIKAAITEQRREAETLQTAMAAGRGDLTGLAGIRTGWKRLDKGLAIAAKNPNLMLYKLQSNAYKFGWVLIPLSLPIIWLLFPFARRYNAYDHAVFVTYSLCFVSLILAVTSLLGMVGINGSFLLLMASITIPLHMYKQMRGTYSLSRAGALVRVLPLLIGASFSVAVLALILTGLGLVG